MFNIQTEVCLEHFDDILADLWFSSGENYKDNTFASEFYVREWYDTGTHEPGCKFKHFNNLMDAVDYINVLRKDKEYREAHHE